MSEPAIEAEIVTETESTRVETESTRVETESIRESTRDEWVGAATAYKFVGLTKSSFQRAIAHLLGVRGCRADSIRRGNSQNTRYSRLAIELVKAHKSGDEELLLQLLEVANKPASRNQSSGLAVIDHVASLEAKIARLQQTTAASSQLNANRLREKLAAITSCNEAAQQRTKVLRDAELLDAENRGIEKALAIFEAEERAKESVLAHLRTSKISGNQQ
jgi:hypothetical protein